MRLCGGCVEAGGLPRVEEVQTNPLPLLSPFTTLPVSSLLSLQGARVAAVRRRRAVEPVRGMPGGPGGLTDFLHTSQLLHLCQLVSGCLLCPAQGPTCMARCAHHAHTPAVCPPTHHRHPAAHPPCAETTRTSACARSASLPRRRRRNRRSGGRESAARGRPPWRMVAGWTRWGLARHSLGLRVGAAVSGLSAVAGGGGLGWHVGPRGAGCMAQGASLVGLRGAVPTIWLIECGCPSHRPTCASTWTPRPSGRGAAEGYSWVQQSSIRNDAHGTAWGTEWHSSMRLPLGPVVHTDTCLLTTSHDCYTRTLGRRGSVNRSTLCGLL